MQFVGVGIVIFFLLESVTIIVVNNLGICCKEIVVHMNFLMLESSLFFVGIVIIFCWK